MDDPVSYQVRMTVEMTVKAKSREEAAKIVKRKITETDMRHIGRFINDVDIREVWR